MEQAHLDWKSCYLRLEDVQRCDEITHFRHLSSAGSGHSLARKTSLSEAASAESIRKISHIGDSIGPLSMVMEGYSGGFFRFDVPALNKLFSLLTLTILWLVSVPLILLLTPVLMLSAGFLFYRKVAATNAPAFRAAPVGRFRPNAIHFPPRWRWEHFALALH
jgi:hypothetical protein